MPRHRKDGFWMELDAFNWKFSMSNPHYLVVIDRLGAHFEAFRHTLSFRDKRMVSRSLESTLYSTKNPLSIVSDRAGLSLTQCRRTSCSVDERGNNALLLDA